MGRLRDNPIWLQAIVLLIIVAVMVGLSILRTESDEQKIRSWADENGYEVVQVTRTLQHGPFWFVDEEDTIYQVELRDRFERPKTSWFQIGEAFKFNQEWDE